MQQGDVTLQDRYVRRSGSVLISGVQALVRLVLIQAERDRAVGLSTGGFVSGYRGSPLGTLDATFATAEALVSDHGVVVRPAVNEELAATAVAGTQQIKQSPGARVDGVFALWYGKGPGLERASDAIRHGNMQGSSPEGGVVLAVGDDHLAKSSTVTCYSDEVVAALQIPLLYPADAGEIVRYGLHAFAMSRHTGAWSALKILTEVADATRVVPADEMELQIALPEVAAPTTGLHNRWPDMPLEQELRHRDFRMPAMHAYVRANRLDEALLKSDKSRIGIVAAGKSWLDLREAMDLLGLDDTRLADLGIALYKPALIWPLEPEGIAAFASGLCSLLVVEEKGPFLENQIKARLYGLAGAPAIYGKTDLQGSTLLPATGDLTPERIAYALGMAISRIIDDADVAAAADRARAALATQGRYALPPAIRKPFFCSGCPHNRSTTVPEGSRAMAGIGCHGLAAVNRPRTGTVSQMGGEGIHWMGLSPFTDERHMFANIGDGTYFHSGLLAIRQAVAANLTITYKLLYNSAVAMTGGQPVDGELSVRQVVEQLRAEGVRKIIVSTDDPARYQPDDPVRKLADRVEHRDDFEALQLELRENAGVSVIVYDQMCATEKRRLRKRGKLADPTTRVFINELVCEGCGDCSVKSNCLSVEPVDTIFGTKRRINQSSCNKDYSCLNGFCPSFVTVEGGTPRRSTGIEETSAPLPVLSAPGVIPSGHHRIIVAGVGGTGVVTIGALLAMASHMTGREAAILDQVGLAQKGGAVTSHLHISDGPINALRVPAERADLMLACDQIVGNMRDAMAAISPRKTRVIANADVSITGDFTQDRNARADTSILARRLAERAGPDHFIAFPFTRLSERLLGDAIGSNLMMIGLAWQKGWLPVELEAFEAAVKLNGVSISFNRRAFEWGRRLAVDPQLVFDAAQLTEDAPEDIGSMIERRAAFLASYQDEDYAARFGNQVARVAEAEARVSSSTDLTRAVAKSLFKLMAYKDEYEVARLYTDGSFQESVAKQFDGDVRLSFHLAPPLIAKRDPVTGHLRKRRFGGWMITVFKLLARCRQLRGTPFDPFGWTAERRTERALVTDFEAIIDEIVVGLTAENCDRAVEIATLPIEVRGYGHIKERAVAEYRHALAVALENWRSSTTAVASTHVAFPMKGGATA